MNNERTIQFRTPALALDKNPAAALWAVSLTKREGENDVLRFVIRRDLSRAVESFTIRYRFSKLPVFTPDKDNKFNTYIYDADDVNTSPSIEISAVIPSTLSVLDCGAYISEIKFIDGSTVSYDAAEYRFMRKLTQAPAAPAPTPVQSVKAQVPTAPNKTQSAPKATVQNNSAKAAQKKRMLTESEREARRGKRLIVILGAVLAALVFEVIGGVALYRYIGVRNSTDMLMRGERYNEAYKIALDSGKKSLLQRVCEKAAAHYNDLGDLEMAYIYAKGAPDEFTDLIIDYAARSVINASTVKINENAFRVAKMSDNDEKFDSITRNVCEILMGGGDYTNALRVASEIRSLEARDKTESDVFLGALRYYISAHRYREAAAFIEELQNIDTFEYEKADVIDSAIAVARELKDNAGIIYISQRYPEYSDISAADTYIAEDDAGVRSEFSIIYPLLSTEQRRLYHAHSIAVWNNDVKIIKNGTLEGTKIKDALSVDTNETVTLVLHKSGKVSVIANSKMTAPFSSPSYTDIIDIALGEDHAVLLHADGTVSVLGKNRYGEADVEAWTDIVAVAAGQHFTLGLKANGTVVAAGSNSCGQCDVSVYRNVVDIAACNQSAVMLFSDGTVMVQGYRSMGLADVEELSGVTHIRAGGAGILTALEDGTYKLFTGSYGGSHGDPYNWLNMTAFDVGVMCIAGVDNIGVLFCDGDGIPS